MEKIPYFIFFRAVNENACMSLITSSMWYFFILLHFFTWKLVQKIGKKHLFPLSVFGTIIDRYKHLWNIYYFVKLYSWTTNMFEDTIYLCWHSKKRVDIESIYIQYVQFAKCHISHLYKIAVGVTTLLNRYERKKGFFKSLIQMRRKMFALTKT